MYKSPLVLLSLLLTGCVRTVIWDGNLPSKEFHITFADQNGKPVSGVSFNCAGLGENSPSNRIANALNQSATSSDENGLLILKHNGSDVGGSYKTFGPFEWSHTEIDSAICNFYLSKKLVYSGSINEFNQPVTIVVDDHAT
jgi:hypothetical protein